MRRGGPRRTWRALSVRIRRRRRGRRRGRRSTHRRRRRNLRGWRCTRNPIPRRACAGGVRGVRLGRDGERVGGVHGGAVRHPHLGGLEASRVERLGLGVQADARDPASLQVSRRVVHALADVAQGREGRRRRARRRNLYRRFRPAVTHSDECEASDASSGDRRSASPPPPTTHLSVTAGRVGGGFSPFDERRMNYFCDTRPRVFSRSRRKSRNAHRRTLGSYRASETSVVAGTWPRLETLRDVARVRLTVRPARCQDAHGAPDALGALLARRVPLARAEEGPLARRQGEGQGHLRQHRRA